MLVDDPVKRVDNMTMAWGLEARVPFLDHELVELAARIPPELKLEDGGKGVLKDVARLVVPHEVIDRPKGYFPVPRSSTSTAPIWTWSGTPWRRCRRASAACSGKTTSSSCSPRPEKHITPLRGSELWQVALLEIWLQNHGI